MQAHSVSNKFWSCLAYPPPSQPMPGVDAAAQPQGDIEGAEPEPAAAPLHAGCLQAVANKLTGLAMPCSAKSAAVRIGMGALAAATVVSTVVGVSCSQSSGMATRDLAVFTLASGTFGAIIGGLAVYTLDGPRGAGAVPT